VRGEDEKLLGALSFRGTWRGYQQEALDTLDEHWADGRVHIVAAPGSGKTVLGIELARRIGRPTLVLAPTTAIRDQWIDRIAELFLPEACDVNAVASTDIADGRPVTVLTYQKLFSLVAEEAPGPFEAWVERIRTAPPTLVLDEAHHLRREWWRAIGTLRERLGDHFIVALTATPPYDVELQEWTRYETLCGPIDAEIGAPALVQTGDLCPHQDLIHLSRPPLEEEELYYHYAKALAAYLDQLVADPALLALIDGHGWIVDPYCHEELILERPELFTAFLTYLANANRPIPIDARKLLGVGTAEIPAMTREWMERLLNGLIFELEPQGLEERELLKSIERELRRLGSISGDRVKLAQDLRFASSFASSLAKLSSIAVIARTEAQSLGDRLRLLVLSDHVRAADLPKAVGETARPTKLGVVPIFEALRLEAVTDRRLGVLTGTLVILPAAAVLAAREAAARLGIDESQFVFRPLAHDAAYCRLSASGRAAERTVALVTRLFEDGQVNTLVGTQSLLGEGWDAPRVNALIIASNVGTSMLSNQIRGRAIRSDPLDPAKTANIWHLATIVPAAEEGRWGGAGRDDLDIHGGWGPDMDILVRRFRSFEGLAAGPAKPIENGLGRMELPLNPANVSWVDLFNGRMAAKAIDRPAIADNWRSALVQHGPKARIRRQIVSNHGPARLVVSDTLQYLALSGLAGGLLSAGWELRNMSGWSDFTSAALLIGGLTLLYSLPKTGKALWLWFRNGTVERSLGQVARAVIGAMAETDMLHGCPENIGIHVERDLAGRARLSLLDLPRNDERLILEAVTEVIGPIANPRYLLVRRSFFLGGLRYDYHAVPSRLGQRKEYAEAFAAHWRRHIGSCRLKFCRNAKGRRNLLRARARSMANAMQHWQDQLSVWE
jgi:superfamily II DNA or RNA helicase